MPSDFEDDFFEGPAALAANAECCSGEYPCQGECVNKEEEVSKCVRWGECLLCGHENCAWCPECSPQVPEW